MRTTFALIFVILLSAFTINMALAATLRCTVEQVDGEKVILNCGEKAVKIEPGTKVKVKTANTTAAIEGC
jgi:hypothetical protein